MAASPSPPPRRAATAHALPLPPLPRLPGAPDGEARPGGRDMLRILAGEHRALRARVARLAAGPGTRGAASRLTAALTRHLSAEEQYLYPTVAAAGPDGERLAEAEVRADGDLLRALRDLENQSADRDAVERVGAALHRHVRRCEDDLFPRVRRACGAGERIRLGNRLLIASEAAPSRPHPHVPARPPWNRVVAPLVGVADKVRDLMSGRATWS